MNKIYNVELKVSDPDTDKHIVAQMSSNMIIEHLLDSGVNILVQAYKTAVDHLENQTILPTE